MNLPAHDRREVGERVRLRTSQRSGRLVRFGEEPIQFRLDTLNQLDSVFTAPLNWRFRSGERLEFNVVPTGERLDAPFEVADGVTIAPGTHN